MPRLRNVLVVLKRELMSYFESPVAYVFMVFFLLLIGFLTFSVSRLYERNMADLQPFFFWYPWVFLILVPAATMGLWAEERDTGTIELLLTMPITLSEALLGKFLASWMFMVIGIALTFPVVVTVAILGDPDMGAIIGGYIGTALLAGACASIGMLTSSTTRSQVISYVVSFTICLVLLLAGWEPITDFFSKWAPAWLVDTVAAFSFIPHFEALRRGVVDLRDVAYYASVIVFMLFATHVVVENRKSA